MFTVQIKELAPMRVAGLAHLGPYMKISAAFQKVAGLFTQHNLWPQAVGPSVGFYYDSPDNTPADQLRAHAGILVSSQAVLPAPLEDLQIPAGRYAILRHVGPYSDLHLAWHWLYSDWLPKSGEAAADSAPFEMNINDPMDTKPADLITDICVRLR